MYLVLSLESHARTYGIVPQNNSQGTLQLEAAMKNILNTVLHVHYGGEVSVLLHLILRPRKFWRAAIKYEDGWSEVDVAPRVQQGMRCAKWQRAQGKPGGRKPPADPMDELRRMWGWGASFKFLFPVYISD